jgi:3-hydroxymyristoyl/3-hydroxydecanoyl-(acyl carrier protein) dehydratase
LAATELVFAADHPAALGHFPGNPIIPGALLLSETLQAVAASAGFDWLRCTVRWAKFFRPTRPGDRVRIEHSRRADGSIRFRCLVMDAAVLAGEVTCGKTAAG